MYFLNSTVRKLLLIYGAFFLVCLYFASCISEIMQWSYNYITGEHLLFLHLSAIREILSYIEISLVLSILVLSPILLRYSWRYLFARFHKKYENVNIVWKIYIRISFALGSAFFLFAVMPNYFRDVAEAHSRVFAQMSHPAVDISSYIHFVGSGILIAGLLSQIPIACYFLNSIRKRSGINVSK